MAEAEARIRPYAADDQKLVLFMVGKANLQSLAIANNMVYKHPLTIAVWLGLSFLMIHYMSWWPAGQYGWLEYLKPLPALASVAVPVMFFVDWINRPYFEDLTQEVIRHPDLVNIRTYYSKSPASGFWLLEYGKTFVGLIAVDAPKHPSKTDRQANGAEKAPKTALIRHFYVEEAFRTANIQDDLLSYAVNHAFNNDPKLERIEASDSPLMHYLRPCLRVAGFELDHHTKTVGILKWSLGTRYLERARWSKKSD
ncbi:hypothetical protein GALMADRAFT_83372 [Galerina marginata CBS 339.88]|uniref:Uncharacterized protein n=1 Tax=Galerina marginata (strain CBS 339.88) TaxID=685588 RepID=A0A067TRW0_GALM3|nr:hypothetical protein GALMADRAFT_83372 [Galerina marginata CBS 339.88]